MKIIVLSLTSVLLASICILSTPTTVLAGEGDKSCDASIVQFSCPLCGGMKVNDCLECDGFTNTGMC